MLARCRCCLLLPLWFAAAPALAVDGVIEINQAKAIAGGVTPSDTPGYPVILDASGSYRLTGNLIPTPGLDGIRIAANDVTIDLNGFAIFGPNSCTGFPVTSCGSVILGDGVAGPSTNYGITVRNGIVQSMRNGINLGSAALVEQLTVIGNITGIQVGDFSTVRGCRAGSNLGGIYTGADSTIEDSEAHANGGGIGVGARSIVRSNRVFLSGTAGVSVTGPGLVERNVISNNNVSGILGIGGIYVQGAADRLVRIESNVLNANTGGDIVGVGISSAGNNICTNVGC